MAEINLSDKAQLLREVPKLFGSGKPIDPALFKAFVNAQNDGATSGPGIGQRVPDFTLADQNGKSHTLRQLMGANGLLLVFSRSADW